MSQAGINSVTSGMLPPDVPLTFHTDNNGVSGGDAVPAGNAITFAAEVNSDNSVTGFTITGSGSTVTYAITNTIIGAASTTDATPENILLVDPASTNFPLGGIPGLFEFESTIIGVAGNGAVYYKIFCAIFTDGATASIVPSQQRLISEDNGTGGKDDMTACDAIIAVSGNNVNFQVTGIGTAIDWSLFCNYRRVT